MIKFYKMINLKIYPYINLLILLSKLSVKGIPNCLKLIRKKIHSTCYNKNTVVTTIIFRKLNLNINLKKSPTLRILLNRLQSIQLNNFLFNQLIALTNNQPN